MRITSPTDTWALITRGAVVAVRGLPQSNALQAIARHPRTARPQPAHVKITLMVSWYVQVGLARGILFIIAPAGAPRAISSWPPAAYVSLRIVWFRASNLRTTKQNAAATNKGNESGQCWWE